MQRILTLLIVAILIGASNVGAAVDAPRGRSTRVTDPTQHAHTGTTMYPHRASASIIMDELDLRDGDVVVDVGAGDGWWSAQMAEHVGEKGVVHALEVSQKKVDEMKKKVAGSPQVRPYLGPFDGTDLPENSCDLAFFSQVYHHIKKDGRIDYLRHLRKVVKPTGRLAIIEKHEVIATNKKVHGMAPSLLASETEEAGWILVRYELLTGTYHYLAIFVQQDLFPPEPAGGPGQGARGKRQGAGASAPAAKTPSGHTADTLEVVKARLASGEAMLIDVREKEEWDAGHLAQAVSVPLSKLQSDPKGATADLAKDKVVYGHCRSGQRVLEAAEILRKQGYDIRPLKAGYAQLVEDGWK